jgi:hypothetical protein
VTAPGAMAGLIYATNKLAKNESITTHTFLDGFQKYFWVSWRLTLLNCAVFLMAYWNINFYQSMALSYLKWPLGIVLGLIFIWAVLHIYTLPLIVEQNSNQLLAIIQKSVLLLLRHPGPSYVTAIVMLIFTLISIWLFGIPLLIFFGSLCAYLFNTTLMYVLGNTEYIDQVVR